MKKCLKTLFITAIMLVGIQGVSAENLQVCEYRDVKVSYNSSNYSVVTPEHGTVKVLFNKNEFTGSTTEECPDKIYRSVCNQNVYYQLEKTSSECSVAGEEYKLTNKKTVEENTPEGEDAEGKSCNDLIGDNTMGIIKEFYGYLRIFVPLVIIIMGIVDFLKVIAMGDEKDMKKAQSNLVKRVIVGIVFFIVPVLVSGILRISGITEEYDFGSKDSDAIFCIFINE